MLDTQIFELLRMRISGDLKGGSVRFHGMRLPQMFFEWMSPPSNRLSLGLGQKLGQVVYLFLSLLGCCHFDLSCAVSVEVGRG